jgi:hypothetical protein
MMVDSILVYISAAFDLEIERAVLPRVITEIPVTLAWRILQTPHIGESPDENALRNADMHLLILGSDIRAPVGYEWLIARRSGNSPILYLKDNISRTSAAQVFVREIGMQSTWYTYKDIPDLRFQVLTSLGNYLLKRKIYFSLGAAETDDLKDWLTNLQKTGHGAVDEIRGGTGENSVLLSPERYVPSEGVLIKAPDDQSS